MDVDAGEVEEEEADVDVDAGEVEEEDGEDEELEEAVVEEEGVCGCTSTARSLNSVCP